MVARWFFLFPHSVPSVVPFRAFLQPESLIPAPRMLYSLMHRSLLVVLAVGSHAEFDACGRPAGSWLGIDQVCCTISCAASIHALSAETLGNRVRAGVGLGHGLGICMHCTRAQRCASAAALPTLQTCCPWAAVHGPRLTDSRHDSCSAGSGQVRGEGRGRGQLERLRLLSQPRRSPLRRMPQRARTLD